MTPPDGWAPISQLVAVLNAMHRSSRGEWLGLAGRIDGLRVLTIGSPVPPNLQVPAQSARNVAQRMPYLTGGDNEVAAARMVLSGLATLLTGEIAHQSDAMTASVAEEDKPYHLRGDR